MTRRFSVVERELRAASRRSLTYWARVAAGCVPLIVIGPTLIMMELNARFGLGTMPVQYLGPFIFGALVAVCFITCIAAGCFFASDAISFERREGTLELLFLAPVRPAQVVFSKLATAWWRGAQWLLAVLPLLALPILLGGVMGLDFIVLAVLTGNLLLWSVSISLWASARSQGLTESLLTAAIAQALLIGLPYFTDLALAGFSTAAFRERVSMGSPLYAWVHGFRTPDFETATLSAAIVHAQAWVFFLLAARATARDIRRNPSGKSVSLRERLAGTWTFGRPAARSRLRKRLVGVQSQPIRWLVERERGPLRFLIILPLILAAVVASTASAIGNLAATHAIGLLAAIILGGTIAVLLALQASRFLLEARRTGTLELILVSPITTRSILTEQCRSLFRTFAIPIALVVGAHLVHAVSQHIMLRNSLGPMFGTPGTPGQPTPGTYAAMRTIASIVNTMLILLSSVAVAWVGFWMGVVCRHITVALFATLALAKVGPMIVLSMAGNILTPMVLSQRLPFWAPSLASFLTGILLYTGLIVVARRQLLPDLRRILENPFVVLWPSRTPPPPPPPAAPPVLTR
jgi:ABC-type transport system involved in multi-copper enzyme maturation permease subunit